MQEFQIDFNYQDVPYVGLVTPIDVGSNTSYKINLESENQESFVEIVGSPSAGEPGDWKFICSNGNNPTDYYDKQLLQEIGEAIEKKLTSTE